LLWHFTTTAHSPPTALALFIVIVGSLLVSYTRARAEGLGQTCTVGLMERPERMVILIVGAIVGGPVFTVLLWTLAVLVNITAVHRIVHVYGKLSG
jgi:CDP-diacylglycerol--glycerol-3-phosphate 3-phosphatidyltransferase